MSPKLRRLITGLTALSLLGPAPWTRSWAQTAQSSKPHRPTVHPVRPYVVITPGPLLYRRCTDWLELQYRPSGMVLYPKYRCWWVRG